MSSVDRKASRKTVSSSICVYKEVKVNLQYRHSLQVIKKRPETRTVSMQTTMCKCLRTGRHLSRHFLWKEMFCTEL